MTDVVTDDFRGRVYPTTTQAVAGEVTWLLTACVDGLLNAGVYVPGVSILVACYDVPDGQVGTCSCTDPNPVAVRYGMG